MLDAARRRPAVVTWRRLPFSFLSLSSCLSKTRAGERGEERRRFRLTLTLSHSQLTHAHAHAHAQTHTPTHSHAHSRSNTHSNSPPSRRTHPLQTAHTPHNTHRWSIELIRGGFGSGGGGGRSAVRIRIRIDRSRARSAWWLLRSGSSGEIRMHHTDHLERCGSGSTDRALGMVVALEWSQEDKRRERSLCTHAPPCLVISLYRC